MAQLDQWMAQVDLVLQTRTKQLIGRQLLGGRTACMLGSTRLLTDAGGSAVQRYEYDPYGATSQSSTAYTNPYQYTGREKDINGLYYYRARYYRPDLGGFISEDPIQLAGGVNQYMYVNESPIINVDPFGLRVDLIKMIDYMNAHANRKSKGQCAKYVRQGLEAVGADTSGHPIAAADYGPTLEKNDFSPIDPSAAPESGDITVFPAIPGHPYGHIEAYDGSSYVSDFSQSNFYPSPAYEGSGPVTYRLNPGPSLYPPPFDSGLDWFWR
nr:RHS repeat-associated core domain-containing protein [Xanthomonas oryzae]